MKPEIIATAAFRRLSHFGIRAALPLALMHAVPLASADVLNLGTASQYAVLAMNDGTLSINSATTVSGVVGAAKNVTVQQAQKVDTFLGRADIHSGTATTTFRANYAPATFAPSEGIQYGPGTIDARLIKASADAANASYSYAALTPSSGPNVLGNVTTNRSLVGNGGTNVYSVGSWSYNSNVLTLTGTANDIFIFNISGNLAWAQSTVKLVGITANQVLFNFTGSTSNSILVNKSATVFRGTILSPRVPVTYHNPATFEGRIIATNISLHSAFNLTAPPPLPQPGLPFVPPTGSLGISNTIFLAGTIIPVSYNIKLNSAN